MEVTQLKMKELAEVEKLSGLTMDQWDSPTVNLAMAVTYVISKRTNPNIKWEEVEEMTIDQMVNFAEVLEDPKATKS